MSKTFDVAFFIIFSPLPKKIKKTIAYLKKIYYLCKCKVSCWGVRVGLCRTETLQTYYIGVYRRFVLMFSKLRNFQNYLQT